jgi:hypothetical protein
VWGDGVSDPSLLHCEVTIDRGLFDPHLRELMAAFFAKGLRRNPQERFDNAEDMLRAWRRIFETATAHEPPSEEGDPFERAARSLTPTSTIAEVGYSPAALSVLEGMGIQTVRDLLAVDRARFRYLSSVADRTRKEIRLTAKRLAQARPDLAPDGGGAATSEGPADRRDVDYLVERLRPRETEEHRGWQAVELYLGLADGVPHAVRGWASVGEAAQLAQAGRQELIESLVAARERWRELKPLRGIRDQISSWISVPGRVKTLRGITAPGILRLVVTLRAKKCKNSSSAQRYNQIRFRFHTAWVLGCVKTLHRKCRGIAILADCRVGAFFWV